MGSVDTILSLKQAQQADLETIESKKAPVQAKIAELDQLAADVEAEKIAFAEAEGQKKYDEGHAAGVEVGFEQGLAQAGQAGGSDKIYSDAEYNEGVALAKAPLEAQIAELQASVASLNEQVSGHASQVETAKSEAVAEA